MYAKMRLLERWMKPFRKSHTFRLIKARCRLCRRRCVTKTVVANVNHKMHNEEEINEELIHIHRDQVQIQKKDAANRKIN